MTRMAGMSGLPHNLDGTSKPELRTWRKHPVVVGLKRNRVVGALYNGWLDLLCRNVESYIFVATTGRSGTSSLTRVFETAVDAVASRHEPHPVMFSDFPQGIDREEYFQKLFRTLKRIYIKRAAAGHRYYLETNHQFIKNFAVPAIEHFGSKIRIIHLKRDPVSVAASFFAIGSIPVNTQRGRYYLLDPSDHTNLIRMPELLDVSGQFGHDLYKCLWYWYEIEARVKVIRQRYPAVTWVDVETEQLNDLTALRSMFEQLGISVRPDRLSRAVSIRENRRTEEKREVVDQVRCEEMNRKLKARILELYGSDPSSG